MKYSTEWEKSFLCTFPFSFRIFNGNNTIQCEGQNEKRKRK